MAAASDHSGGWIALIFSKSEERNRMFTVAATTTVAEVRQRWLTATAFSGDVELRSASGEGLSGQQTMEEVGEATPGSKTVHLHADEAVSVRLQVFKGDSATQISLRLAQSPEELFPVIREALPILGDRLFRLRTAWDSLEDERSLADQDVDEHTPLFVDPSIDVDVTDQWEGDTQEVTVFSSELVAVLAAADDHFQCQRRFVLGRTALRLWDDFADAVGVVAPSMPLCLLDIRQRHVTLCVGGRFVQRVVWPDTTVGKVLPASWSLAWPVIFNGKQLLPADTMLQVGVSDDAVIVDAVRVHVRLSSGDCTVVRVPRLGVVADVAAAVERREAAGRWRLRCAGRLLDSDEPIPSSATTGRAMEVDRALSTFTVALFEGPVEWTTDRRPMSFSNFVNQLARHSGVKYAELLKRTYQCRGCRRRVMIEEEGHQLLPAPCCHVQSLSLSEVAGKAVAGTQAASSLHTTTPTPEIAPTFCLPDDFDDELTLKRGSCHTVELPFEASPQPTLVWTWNMDGLPRRVETEVYNAARLHMDKVELGDAGVYRLKLKNELGQATVDVHLTVIDVPTAPKDVHALLHKSLQLTLTWTVPDLDGADDLSDYVIEKKEEGGRSWEPVATVAASKTSCEVESLPEGKRYAFRVSAVNSAGKGPACETPNAVHIKKPETRWFWFFNDRTDSGPYATDQSFDVAGDASFRDLREAVARRLDVASDTVVLSCLFCRVDGEELTWVKDERGQAFFVAEGKERPWSEVKSPRYWRRMEDGEAIPVFPGKRLLLRASSLPLLPFYVVNNVKDFNRGEDFWAAFPVREHGRAAELAAAVARFMELPSTDVVLSRRGGFHRGVAVAAVVDEEDGSVYFSDFGGRSRFEPDDVDWSWETLGSHDGFRRIPDVSNEIRVSRRS